MRLLILSLFLLITACATTPLGKTYDASETIIAITNVAADLIDSGKIDQSHKPRIEACIDSAWALNEWTRDQIKKGLKPSLNLAFDYIKVIEDFLFEHKDNLEACT